MDPGVGFVRACENLHLSPESGDGHEGSKQHASQHRMGHYGHGAQVFPGCKASRLSTRTDDVSHVDHEVTGSICDQLMDDGIEDRQDPGPEGSPLHVGSCHLQGLRKASKDKRAGRNTHAGLVAIFQCRKCHKTQSDHEDAGGTSRVGVGVFEGRPREGVPSRAGSIFVSFLDRGGP
jgi:hypothetical protein